MADFEWVYRETVVRTSLLIARSDPSGPSPPAPAVSHRRRGRAGWTGLALLLVALAARGAWAREARTGIAPAGRRGGAARLVADAERAALATGQTPAGGGRRVA